MQIIQVLDNDDFFEKRTHNIYGLIYAEKHAPTRLPYYCIRRDKNCFVLGKMTNTPSLSQFSFIPFVAVPNVSTLQTLLNIIKKNSIR